MHKQVVDRRYTDGFSARPKERRYVITPKERLERICYGAPEIAHGQTKARDHEYRSLSKVLHCKRVSMSQT